MKKLAAASGAFLLFLFSGGLWIGLVQLVPAGIPRSIAIIAVGVLFAGVFVWLLVSRVRRILLGSGNLLRHALVTVLEVAMMLAAFAAVYQKVGIVDTTRSGSPTTHSYLDSLYYSVVTFTTLGYGDFYPQGPGRALAGIEALTGYLVLGILASTAASLISPYDRAGPGEDSEESS